MVLQEFNWVHLEYADYIDVYKVGALPHKVYSPRSFCLRFFLVGVGSSSACTCTALHNV